MNNETNDQSSVCPECGQPGRPVKSGTLSALLKPEAKQVLNEEVSWRFCTGAECDTVYFSADTDTTFGTSDLTVRVGIKENCAPRPVCYCFDHSIEEIEEQIRSTRKTDVLDDIKSRMQQGCWCETKSPLGACCLSTVTKCVRAAEEKFQVEPKGASDAANLAASKSSKGEKVAWAGVVSALVASACCWLPMVLIGFGVSGAAVSAAFENYRPWFMALTIGFLGTAFWFTYRPQKTCAAEESCCGPETNATSKKMGFNRAMLWVITAVAAVFLLFPSYVGSFTGGGKPLDPNKDLYVTVVKIEGMTCEGCASGLEKSLSELPGIDGVAVSYEQAVAKIGIPQGSTLPRADVLDAIKSAGFSGQLSEEDKEPESSR